MGMSSGLEKLRKSLRIENWNKFHEIEFENWTLRIKLKRLKGLIFKNWWHQVEIDDFDCQNEVIAMKDLQNGLIIIYCKLWDKLLLRSIYKY